MKAWAKRAAAPFVAVVDNPILLKELRAGMRGARYFIAFVTILSLVSAVLLITFALTGGRSEDPALIGSRVFALAFMLNLVVAFLVVPSFGATSITSERERQTYDILMSTTLSARQIIWGKLLASLAQVGAIFLSTIPILGLTFLFGGVTVRQMVASYTTLFLVCILLSSWAISISASCHTSQRAVASSYGGAILVFIVMWILIGIIARTSLATAYAETYGITDLSSIFGHSTPISPWARVLYVYLLPAFGFVSFVVLVLLNAATRLKSPFDEKSPPFRLYFLVVTVTGFTLAYSIFMTDIVTEPTDDRLAFFMVMTSLAFLVSSVSCVFAAEAAVPPPYIRERYARLRGLRRWRWILAPGSRNGIVFCLVSNIVLVLATVLLYRGHTHGMNQGTWSEHASYVPLLRAVTVIATWTVFLSGVAAWIVTVLPGRPRTVGAIVCLLVIAMGAIPLVHWSATSTVPEVMAYQGEAIGGFPGPVTLILSPIAGFWTALTPHHDGLHTLPLVVRFFGIELPLHAFQAGLFMLTGVILHAIADRRRTRLQKVVA